MHTFSSSDTSVPVKVGIFLAKIQSENDHHIHQIIYQLEVKDLLYHSVQKPFFIVVKLMSVRRTKWANLMFSEQNFSQSHINYHGCVQ